MKKKEEPLANPTILIVDDDEIIRKMLRRIILKTYPQATIVEAADGFKAEEQAASSKPSLIVLDIYMPGMSGFDVCAKIRQDPSMKDVNILMITGNATSDMKEMASQVGADAFLIKPLNSDAFLSTVSQLLQRYRNR